LLRRDISLQNILLKVFDSGAVLVKLSDFGLVKDQSSQFTRTQTETKGTVRDPTLSSFSHYGVVNEIHAIGDTPRLLVSSPDAAADAAIDGVGATLLLEHDVAEAVRAGKLQFILQEFEVDPIPVHLVHLSRDMMPVKLRRFIDFAAPRLSAALSEGRSIIKD